MDALTVQDLLLKINQYILNPIIILMFFIATAVFVWGIVQFIANAGSEESRSKGKRNIIFGIMGIVIMISVYGILNLVVDTFDIRTEKGTSPIQEYIQGSQ